MSGNNISTPSASPPKSSPLLAPISWLYAASAAPFLYTMSFGSADRLLMVSERLYPPGSFLQHVLRGIYYERLKMYSEALKSNHLALDINDRNHVPYLNLASSLFEFGRIEESLEYCNRAMAMGKPSDKWKAFALSTRVDVMCAMGKMEPAKEDVETIFQLMKHDPIALATRAKVSAAKGEYQRALEDLDKAIEKCEPLYKPQFLEQRGAVYARLSGPDAAATDRLRAAELRKNWLNETNLLSKTAFQSSLVRTGTVVVVLAVIAFVFLNRESTLGLMLVPLLVFSLFKRCLVGLLVGAVAGMLLLVSVGTFVPIRFWEKSQGTPVAFKTQTVQGKPFLLDGWKGKTVIAYTALAGSDKEKDYAVSLKDFYNKYPRTKLEIVGIVDGGNAKNVSKTPWPIVNSKSLDEITKNLLEQFNTQSTFLLSPLDHHIVARGSNSSAISVPLDWIMKSQVDMAKYSHHEVRTLAWILDLLMMVPVMLFMFLDRKLQKFVTGWD